MGAVTRPGRRIKCRVGVVSLTASLYNSHLPQFANPTVVNPKASSTKQMGKGGPWPGFASQSSTERRMGPAHPSSPRAKQSKESERWQQCYVALR